MSGNLATVFTIGTVDESRNFETLFKSNYARIARLIYRVVGDTAVAEELAAEVFWRYHRKPPALRQNVEGWLCRVAMRIALDSMRMRDRRSRYEALSAPPQSPRNPERTVQQLEEAKRVRSTLAVLKHETAELLLLRSDGASYGEIAAALQLNPASVGTLLSRAEDAFRREYISRYGE